MKALILLAALVSPSAFAAIPDCYTQTNVVKGQFIVMLQPNLDRGVRKELINKLGALELSVVDSFGTTMLVERTALSLQSREEQLATLEGLNALIGKGAQVITCNGISKAL